MTTNPACGGTYFYYKMGANQVESAGQTITDLSGNLSDATNGSTAGTDSNDCVS